MKLFVTLFLLVISPVVFAGEYSIYKMQFDKLSNSEAWQSNKFAKRVWNSQIPGTGTYIPLSTTCISDNELVLKKPINNCLQWKVDGFGVKAQTFDFKDDALDYAKAQKTSEPTCNVPDVIESVPLSEKVPTTFSVEFFIKLPGAANYDWDPDLSVGTRKFKVPECN